MGINVPRLGLLQSRHPSSLGKDKSSWHGPGRSVPSTCRVSFRTKQECGFEGENGCGTFCHRLVMTGPAHYHALSSGWAKHSVYPRSSWIGYDRRLIGRGLTTSPSSPPVGRVAYGRIAPKSVSPRLMRATPGAVDLSISAWLNPVVKAFDSYNNEEEARGDAPRLSWRRPVHSTVGSSENLLLHSFRWTAEMPERSPSLSTGLH